MSSLFASLIKFLTSKPTRQITATIIIFLFLFRRLVIAYYTRNKSTLPPKSKDVHFDIPWVPFSDFLKQVDQGQVTKALFSSHDDIIEFFTLEQGVNPTRTRRTPSHMSTLVGRLFDKQVAFEQLGPLKQEASPWWHTALFVLMPLVYVGIVGYVAYQIVGPEGSLGGGSSNSVGGDSTGSGNKTGFQDVAGVDEASRTVREVCDLVKNPQKYQRAGARLPRGLLLVGPPGTGKTMLARAMATEAGIPFFYCNGSEFVEVFTGRGAARVRALFQRATKAAPAVVFIDEIDALGGARHSGGGFSNNEEREQTLNQLLSCMDGFDSDHRVVVMAATNRYEALDRALTRPGRFDRIVRVDLPNERGRAEILKVHTRTIVLDDDVDLFRIARSCEGFTGAELAALANEAAIRAVRDERDVVKGSDFADALRSFVVSRKSRASPQQSSSGRYFSEAFADFFRSSNSNNNNNNNQQPSDEPDEDEKEGVEELD